jgi:phage shock protein A
MGFLEAVVLRFVLWVVLPVALIVLLIGPRRVGRWLSRFWNWLWCQRQEPEAILTRVVRAQEKRIAALRAALARSESAEQDIIRNMKESYDNIAALEEEARSHVARSDDFGARAAIYKVNLERSALQSFQQQKARQHEHVTEARRRLHLLELQLRQYEVGRSILLSELAEAQTLEQQYAIASKFDPFNAVANWQQAEGMVQEKALSARAVEQVYSDIAELPLTGQPAQVDPAVLDAQFAELKEQVGPADNRAVQNGRKPASDADGRGRNG